MLIALQDKQNLPFQEYERMKFICNVAQPHYGNESRRLIERDHMKLDAKSINVDGSIDPDLYFKIFPSSKMQLSSIVYFVKSFNLTKFRKNNLCYN